MAFGAAAITALAISLGASLWLEHQAQLKTTERMADKANLALERHTQATFDLVDNVLGSTAGQLERAARRGPVTAAAVEEILHRNASGQAAIHGMTVRDAGGRLVAAGLQARLLRTDVSQTDYFTAQRDGPAAGSFIGAPIRSLTTGAWMIPISRRLNDADGKFAGVLVATLPIDFFSDFFRSLQFGEHGVLTIFRAEGTTLVREPEDHLIGVRVPGSPLFTKQLPKSPSGIHRVITVTDRIDRIFSYRKLPNMPLVVTIGIAVDDALADWYKRVRLYIAIWVLCAAVLTAFTALMVRQAGRQEAAQRAAEEIEARFRRLVANVPGVVFQRTHKTDGTVAYTFVSARAQEMYGHSAEDIMARPAMFMEEIASPDYEAALRATAKTLTTLSLDHETTMADGRTRWVRTTSTPSRLPNGDVVWDGVTIDISDRKAMELALRASEAEAERARTLLTDAVESINDGFVLYDADDRLVLMNRTARDWHPDFAAAAVPGATHEELIHAAARTGRIVGHGDDIEMIVSQRLARHRKAFGQPVERCVGGRWYQLTEYPTSRGGVVVLRTDVTALKQANVRLEEAKLLADKASRAKSEFLALMSHELRTPLNAILGFSEIIRDRSELAPSRVHEYAADIHASGALLLTLINDVLDLSKAESGRMELQLVPVDVAEIVERSLRIMKEHALRQGVGLTAETETALPVLYADDRKLMQILLNLLSNAVKFTPAGGRITVAARRETKEMLVIRISDTGVGIADDDMAKALAPFGQIDNLFTRQHSGTGLGLPLAKRLTELHGGAFDIESRVGIGTTVTLRFPLDRKFAAAA